MEMKTTTLVLVAIVLSLIAIGLLKISNAAKEKRTNGASINTYQECIDAGYPASGYPAECKTPDGAAFMDPAQFVQVFTDFAPQGATSTE